MSEKTNIEGVTPKGRVSYPCLWTPRENDNGKLNYEVVLLFPPDADLTQLRKNIVAKAVEEFGAGALDLLKSGKIESPLKKSDEEKVAAGHFEGGFYARFKKFCGNDRKRAPYRFDRDGRLLSEDGGEFYGGCWAAVNYDVFGWRRTGKQGVSFGLIGIRKLADDTRFGGGPPPASDVASRFAEAGFEPELPSDLAAEAEDWADIPF